MGHQRESSKVDAGDGGGEAREVSRARCGPQTLNLPVTGFHSTAFSGNLGLLTEELEEASRRPLSAQPAAPSMLPRTPRGPQSHTHAPTCPQDALFFRARAPFTPRGPQDGRLVLRVPDWGAGQKVTPSRAVTAAPRAHTLPPG